MVRRADHAFLRDAESRARRADWRKRKRILKELVETILAQFRKRSSVLKDAIRRPEIGVAEIGVGPWP